MSLCPAAETGLVAGYTLDEGAGSIAHDQSGNKNCGRIIGEAKWVKETYGSALEFNEEDAYVDCGTSDSLNGVTLAGTTEAWSYPYRVRGGLVNWSTGAGWNDERLALVVDTYHGGKMMLGCIADGESSQTLGDFGEIREKDRWSWSGVGGAETVRTEMDQHCRSSSEHR